MGFSRQEYWSGLPFLSPGDLPNLGIEFMSLMSPALAGGFFTTAAAKSLQSCLTLCDPIDGSPPGPPVPGILQARTLEWVAISFSNSWKWKVKVKSLSCVQLSATPWTAAYQAPPPMGFSRQEYWSGVPLPSPFLYTESHLIQVMPLIWVALLTIQKAELRWGPGGGDDLNMRNAQMIVEVSSRL